MQHFGFTIAETLSVTSHATVYRTTRNARGDCKVLKVLNNYKSKPEEALHYRQEYAIVRQLDHPGVISNIRLFEDNDTLAISYDYFNGISLEQLAKEVLPIVECLEIALLITQALEHIHSRKIIHKDLNPTNILYDRKTKQLKIIDFGISSELDQESKAASFVAHLEGTIAFASPEQTGRMNRVVDYRTDFYSLGMSLYYLFTGKLPFDSKDPMEILHFHLAKKPKDPVRFRADLPQQIATIVMKMVEKSAESRYQSARGILHDLRKCEKEYREKGSISAFPIAHNDISERFSISQKLYGRETETADLVAGFERVAIGNTEFIFVAGYSGIGKTTLVQEVYRPITERNGIFVSGKFDQYQRNIPYSAFINVFNQLIDQALFLPEADLEKMRKDLIEVLGAHASIFTTLVPHLEMIIGPQEGNLHLGPVESQNVFNQLTIKFIKVFATVDHPLVIFIDDFQWADLASLKMLNVVLTDPGMEYLLLIGAYRDNEVDETHPLILTKKEVESKEVALSTITLQPLTMVDIRELVRDTFHVDKELALSLASTLVEKTLGNPFFIIQLLKKLHQDGFISYNPEHSRWEWSEDMLRACKVTDNVVDLMVTKLSGLRVETKRLLMISSCVGQQISLEWLSVITGKSMASIAGDIWPIVEMGLMVPLDETAKLLQVLKNLKAEIDESKLSEIRLKFLHDRVQQASYALIGEENVADLHLSIGRSLKNHLKGEEYENSIFTIIAQFNQAIDAMEDPAELLEMAEFNLLAAHRAKSTLAYHSAIELLGFGLDMLGDELWKDHYDLSYSLYFERAECRFFIAELDKAEEELKYLLGKAVTTIHKAKVYNVFVDLYTTKGEIEQAIFSAIDGCDLFGIKLYPHPTRQQVLEVYDEIKRLIGERKISDLYHLPLMDDEEMEVALSILAAMMPPALFYDENLLYLEHCYMVELSLLHGNAPPSSSGYSYFGMILGCMLGEFEKGYEFGKLGYDLLSKPGFEYYRAKVCLSFGSNVNFWVNHVLSDLKYLEEGFRAAIESGDITYSCYHCNHIVMVNLASGMDLDLVQEDAENRKNYVARTGYTEIVDIIESKQRLVEILRGNTKGPHTYSDENFSEEEFEEHLRSNMSITVCWYYIHKAQARYMFGYFREAIEAAEKADELIWSSVAHVEVPEHYLYYALSLAAVYEDCSEEEQVGLLQNMQTHLDYLKSWKASCVENFEHKYLLIEAEIFRITKQPMLALQCYEKSIEAALTSGFIQLAALANELACKFCLTNNLHSAADSYLSEALRLYGEWKAKGKVDHLYKQFSDRCESLRDKHLLTSQTLNDFNSTPEDKEVPADSIDYTTIVNMSRAIATKIDMDSLLVEIVKYTLENTGAEKASIATIEGADITLELYADEGAIKASNIVSNISENVSDYVSENIIRYVSRTGKTFITGNAVSQGEFAGDQHVLKHGCKSILCMPFSYKKDRSRYLYLENNQVTDAFPVTRVETLALLLPQVAISIENAKLFRDVQEAHDDLQEKTKDLEKSEEQFRQIVDNSVDAIAVLKNSIHTLVNPAYVDMFGYLESGELLGRSVLDLISKEYRADFDAFLGGGQSLSRAYGVQGVRKDDEVISLEVNLSRYGQEGDHNTLLIIRNVTEKKRLESQLHQAQKMEAVGTLAGGIAHDFNNILSAIIGYTELAKTTESSGATLKGYLDQVLRAGERAKELVQQILSFSRQTATERILLNPVTVVDEVLKMLRSTIPTTITLKKDTDDFSGFIWADPVKMHQILLNLGTNAYHAMETTGGVLCYSIKQVLLGKEDLHFRGDKKDNRYVRLTVSDTGPGIPVEIRDKIFDPYFTTKKTGKGTGMGLSIAHGIVKSYDGFITFENRQERGTDFHVYLPLVQQKRPGIPTEVNGDLPQGSENILYIDDEAVIADLGKMTLEELGYQVTSLYSPTEALDLFNQNPDQFDLIITDQTMPEMTGSDFAQKVLQAKPHLPIILCTGYSTIISEDEAKKLGIKEFALKPVSMVTLAKMVRRVLDNS